MAEEREFEVIDKRRIRSEGEGKPPGSGEGGGAVKHSPPPGEAAAGQPPPGSTEAPPQPGPESGDIPHLDVPGVLSVCVNMLNEVAWMKLGLIPNLDGREDRDLAQAKIAIDAIADLAARLDPLVAEGDRRDLQVMLSNLRINFVQQSRRP
jgi:hypothetical protein